MLEKTALFEPDERRTHFLAEAGDLLASSLDLETTLSHIMHLSVPYLADWCVIDLLQPDGSLRRLPVAHVDPTKAEAAARLQTFPPGPNPNHPVLKAIHTRQAQWVPEIDDAWLASIARDAAHLDLLKTLGYRSAIYAPLLSRGEILGVMVFIYAESERRYAESDLAFAEQLARRIAVSIDNARLYAQAQQLNRELDRRVSERTAELSAANQLLQSEVDERRRAEEELRRAKQFSEHVVASVVDYAIFMLDPQGVIINWNAGAERLKQYRAAEIIGRHFSCFYTPADVAQGLPRRLLQLAAEQGHIENEGWRVRKDGSRFWADVVITAIYDEGVLSGFAKVTRDMTERRAAEEQLRESNLRLRELAAHLQSAREEERLRIARELHDDLGQVLTALKMDLSALARKWPDPHMQSDLKQVVAIVDEAIKSVRRILVQLRPEMLEDLGLKAALEWQVQEFQARTGIDSQFESAVDSVELDAERAMAVYRVLQESLTNVGRHANATRVAVDLATEDGKLLLSVADNGKGILPEEMRKTKSFGLLGMRERALLLDGEVNVHSAPGQGTTITLRVPLH